MKYLSKEWVEAAKEKSNTDEAYLKKTKGLTAKVRLVVTDYPGNVDLLLDYELKEGKVVNASRTEKPAPSDLRKLGNEAGYISTAIGSYDTCVKIAKGEMSAMGAMTSRKYTVHGNMLKILPKTAQFNAFAELQASIPCEY